MAQTRETKLVATTPPVVVENLSNDGKLVQSKTWTAEELTKQLEYVQKRAADIQAMQALFVAPTA